MSGTSDGSAGPPPEARAIPPLYIDSDDHTYLLMLLFATHPDLQIDYLGMARASRRMPDPRMWTLLTEIAPRLEPLRRLGRMLREMPSSNDLDPELNTPAVRGAMAPREWARAKEMRAWQRLLQIPLSAIGEDPAARALASIGGQSGHSGADNGSRSVTLSSFAAPLRDDDQGTSSIAEESRRRAQDSEEYGVWIEPSLSVNERAAADEERRLEQRIQERRRARRRGRTIVNMHYGEGSAQAVPPGQHLSEIAEGMETDHDNTDLASSFDPTSDEYDILFSRLALRDGA